MRTLVRSVLALALAVFIAPFIGVTGAQARSFGDGPLDAVKTQAGQYLCADLTKNRLAAMMLAPTWGESAAGTGSPSPEAMGREDTYSLSSSNISLYSFNTLADQRRMFFHGGIGIWMLDDAGLGVSMPAHQRIYVPTAADKVARVMSSAYCNSSGTGAQRRAVAFSSWFSCNNSACETIFQDIYCGTADTVCNVTTDSSVTRMGGMSERTCRYYGDATQFTCFFVHIADAEGATSVWKREPKDGASNGGSPSPLTWDFYNWDGVSGQENRHWMAADSGSPLGDVHARRPEGSTSRGNVSWTWSSNSDELCDLSNSRGHCPPYVPPGA